MTKPKPRSERNAQDGAWELGSVRSTRLEGQLPSGRHGLSREAVLESQRQRLLDAMAALCAAEGYAEVSVAAVVDRAGVSRATFYELFRDKEECFVATMEEGLRRLMAAVMPSVYRGVQLEWPERVAVVIEALLNYLAADPDYSQTAMVEALAGGETAYERYAVGTRMLVTLLDEGRALVGNDTYLPPTTARAVLGAGETLVAGEMAAGRVDRVPDLLPDFLYIALLPYLGQEEALAQAGLVRER